MQILSPREQMLPFKRKEELFFFEITNRFKGAKGQMKGGGLVHSLGAVR
jgi:hypothetical protein